MASKTGGISIGAVNERRLRPVYDHLDNGNNKNALHEADKLLKKQKDLLAAKVLKTIALQRLGREEEAFALSQEVTSLEPTDENSLQGLSLYFREVDRADLIPPIYEAAVKKCPGNEEYLTHLFMAYVREERLKDMQRVALVLYKHHPKNPYLFWGIMSIVMQAQNDEKLGKAMFLPLAERMIEKHIEKGKIEAEAEVRLYLMVLQMLEKHEKSLEVLEGNNTMHLSLDKDSLDQMHMDICQRLGRWRRVNSDNKKLMKRNPDVWNHVLGYLDSLQHLAEDEPKQENSDDAGTSYDNPDGTWEQGVETVIALVEAEKNLEGKPKRRGPFLARFELFLRLKSREDKEDSSASHLAKLGNAVEMFVEYIDLFSRKPCCFGDLKTYAAVLSEEEKKELVKNIIEQEKSFTSEENSSEETSDKEEELKIQRHLFLIKMQRFLGHHDTLAREQKLDLVSDYLQRHARGLKHSRYRPSTDIRVVDDYCMIAANVMIDLYEEGGDPADLWKAIYILELAKQRSSTNFKYKFTLIRLYSMLGVFMPCAHIYDSLDIKHMQQDTLGYIVCHSVSALGHYQLASQAFEASRAYFVSNNKDSLEFLIACFRNGTFHKVSEFVSFRHRVKNSLHSVLTLTEHTYMDLVTQADIEVPFFELLDSCCLSKAKTDFEKLTDNRDFSIQFDWQPENRQLSESQVKTSFRLEKDWLRFRELQVRLIIAMLHHTRGTDASKNEVKDVDVSSLFTELQEVVEESAKDPDVLAEMPFHGPPTSRIKTSMDVNYQKITVIILRLFQQFLQEIRSEGKNELKQLSESLINGLEDALDKCNSGLDLPYVKPTKGVEPEKGAEPNKFHSHSCHDDGHHHHADGHDHGNDHHHHHHDNGCHGDCHHDSTSVHLSPEKSVESALSLPVTESLTKLKRCKLERLVLTCELFSISVLLTYNMRSLVAEVKAGAMKKRRRKKGKQEPLPSIVNFYQELVNDLKQAGEKVKAAVRQMESDAEVMTLDLAGLNVDESLQNGDVETMETDCTKQDEFPPTSGKATPLPNQIVQLASESILNSTNQLVDIVQGRLNNLKFIRIFEK